MNLGHLTIKTRLVGGFAIFSALAALFALASIVSMERLARLPGEFYDHPLAVGTEALEARLAATEIIAGMDGLIGSTDAGRLEGAANRIAEQDAQMQFRVAAMARDLENGGDEARDLAGALAAWRSSREAVIALMRQGRKAEAEAGLRQTVEPLATEALRRLDLVAAHAAANAKEIRDKAGAEQTQGRILVYGMALLIGLAGAASAALIARSILNQLRAIRDTMKMLSEGKLDVEIPEKDGGGLVGEMASTLQIFKKAAQHINGENWIKTAIADLSTEMQSADNPAQLARLVISRLVPLVEGGAGGFYAWNDETGRLDLLASYGFRIRKHMRTSYGVGEGLVGQCAVEKAPILLTEVPDTYIRISSGLGDAPPNAVLVAPLLSKGAVMGVIEIASFTRLGRIKQALIDQLVPMIALHLEVIHRNDHTRRLLEESRQKADELKLSEDLLRSQSAELQATNDELRLKSDELQQQAEELRASEEELRAQREELQATNEELTEKTVALEDRQMALEAAKEESERRAFELGVASRYKSEFLANMSHELRTPLNSLLILAKSLADNEEGNLSADQIDSAKIIHESGSHLLRLINDILDLSKVEAGKMEVVPEDVRIKDYAAGIGRRFSGLAGARSLKLSVALDDRLPAAMRTDLGKLDQIVNNLVGNAIKFTLEGSVAVRLGLSERPPAGMSAAAQGAVLSIAVADTGIGVPEDKRQQIFHAFEQADGSTSRQFGGTGLGLTISQKLAQLLGGTITLDSTPGQGSVFTLYLPLLPAADGEAADGMAARGEATGREATDPARSGSPPLSIPLPLMTAVKDDRAQLVQGDDVILVIEDDDSFARILCDLARKRGFKAIRAADGKSGLQLAERYQPGGILLDIALPEMDGWAVMSSLKENPGLRHVPVHFISAIDESVRGLQMGAAGYLKKPVSKEQMDEVFERLRHFSGDGPRRVLIVDDDPGSRKATALLVKADKVEIVEAGSGRNALELLSTQHFDCMVLDLVLPDITGFELLDRAEAAGIRLPPVVVYSGMDLGYEENLKLREYTDSIVIKGARSPERLVDEVSLFLHSMKESRGSPQRRKPTGESDPGLEGRVVLLVDDDMRNAFALSKVLRARGLKVIVAQDGRKALAQLDESPDIELVLMDVMMPGMDGYAAIRELRSRPRFESLPVIALTAKAMPGDREKCLAAGASDYLSKPVDVAQLTGAMRRWLGLESVPA